MSVVGVTITEAAEQLGVSREALRKRVIRGKIPAHKDSEGVWRVILPGTDSTDIKAADREDSHSPDSLSAPTPQLQSVMDQWLRPLVAEIRELATENGRLKLENEQLRATLESSERPTHIIVPDAPHAPEYAADDEFHATSGTTPHSAPQREITASQRRGSWLRRLLGWE